jgi:DnaJ domain
MSSDSPFFDRIRVKPDKDRRLRAKHPPCEWPGCDGAAAHRAPKGRGREKEYWQFCLSHVREYNHSYNFFAGMSTDDIARYQRDAAFGHRPTWKMGMNGGKPTGRSRGARFGPAFEGADDAFELFGDGQSTDRPRRRETRVIHNAERKALDALGFEGEATTAQIKLRFKELVKRHHPDANGGDRSLEDRLREIIQAYNYLKSVGFK